MDCQSLPELTFEPKSTLSQSDTGVFVCCKSLQSITVPRSVATLALSWSLLNSLTRVDFESTVSFRMMLETGSIDLRHFVIVIVRDGCESVPRPGSILLDLGHADSVHSLQISTIVRSYCPNNVKLY
jgi:hypothetical protein